MDYSNNALSVFIGIQGINIGGLITDYLLLKNGLPSISEVCFDYPVLGFVLISFQIVSPVSLGLHLYYFHKSHL